MYKEETGECIKVTQSQRPRPSGPFGLCYLSVTPDMYKDYPVPSVLFSQLSDAAPFPVSIPGATATDRIFDFRSGTLFERKKVQGRGKAPARTKNTGDGTMKEQAKKLVEAAVHELEVANCEQFSAFVRDAALERAEDLLRAQAVQQVYGNVKADVAELKELVK